ncbi:hypothetical protein SAMN04488057_106110 [Cyclobacterium lianum]|uniref:SnoaL-like domain-containing protein n=1 Tax=Cyclobacterium lianum TaxID=388280 RepID=A0A1M7NVM3_9BACT|nr:hypothetical protein [Cyclobacterium lianum]SHN08134.1 hypothetical protein SAMN04488057_106110 [Cyclobacterium lianum]
MTNIQNSLALAFLPGYLFSCQYEQQINKEDKEGNLPVTTNPRELSDQKLIRRYLEGLQLESYDYIKTCIHPDFKCINTNNDSIRDSMEELSHWKAQHQKLRHLSFSDPVLKSVRVNRGILKGDWTLVWTTFSALDGETLKSIKYEYHMAIKTADDKIVEIQTWHQADDESLDQH